jgi:hypothetical protein
VCSGDYRVNFRDGNEMTAYYTDDLEDAVKTAVEMARTRDVTQAVDETVAVERVTRERGTLVLHRARSRRWGLAKIEGLERGLPWRKSAFNLPTLTYSRTPGTSRAPPSWQIERGCY